MTLLKTSASASEKHDSARPSSGAPSKETRTPATKQTALTSAQWIAYFQSNLQEQRIDWQLEPRIDMPRHRKLFESMQAWQLGETSEARHLIHVATKYSRRHDDPEYLDAVKLFIKEEQKHGENLGLYLDRIGMPRVGWDLGDWLFRRVRYFASSMELWTVTVISVEIFAQLYYAALKNAVGCPLLAAICVDILHDEAPHVRFQSERLRTILASRGRTRQWLARRAYWLLFCVITAAVWIGHGRVFRRSGMTFGSYWQRASRRFRRAIPRERSQPTNSKWK